MHILSYNHRLFLRINGIVGKNKILDRYMIFNAHFLIFFLYAGILAFAFLKNLKTGYLFVLHLLIILVLCVVVNWTLAFFVREPRPVIRYPHIKRLIHTLQNFKSFPSDHATVAFVCLFGTFSFFGFNGSSFLYPFIFFLASCVAFGRIYVGVHYPFDVVAGILVAFLVTFSL